MNFRASILRRLMAECLRREDYRQYWHFRRQLGAGADFEITFPMPHYKNDPYWTTARFDSKCAKTGEPIRKGDRIFYYPNGRQAFKGAAAEAAAADFASCAQDEAFMTGEY